MVYALTLIFIFWLGEKNHDGEYILTGVMVIFPLFAWLLITIVVESSIGRTIGNLIVGLKAIPINNINSNLSIGQSFKRHLLDPLDMFFFGLPGIFTILNINKNQRIGDLWAQTIVVKTKNSTKQ